MLILILNAQVSLDFSISLCKDKKSEVFKNFLYDVTNSVSDLNNSERIITWFPLSPWVHRDQPPHANFIFPQMELTHRATQCKLILNIKNQMSQINAKYSKEAGTEYNSHNSYFDNQDGKAFRYLALNHIKRFRSFYYLKIFIFLSEWSNVRNADPRTDLMHWAHDIPDEVDNIQPYAIWINRNEERDNS